MINRKGLQIKLEFVLENNQFDFLISNLTGAPGSYAYMQPDGNLVLYSATGTFYWPSNTNGNVGAYVVLQDDGNLVVRKSNGAGLWAIGYYVLGC